MIKFFKKIFKAFRDGKQLEEVTAALKIEIDRTKALADKYESLIAKADQIHTTIRSFYGENGDKQFWPWVKLLVSSEEYRYMIFLMRENTIREFTQTSAPAMMIEINGKLKMLAEMDIYLNQGLREYERNKN